MHTENWVYVGHTKCHSSISTQSTDHIIPSAEPSVLKPGHNDVIAVLKGLFLNVEKLEKSVAQIIVAWQLYKVVHIGGFGPGLPNDGHN